MIKVKSKINKKEYYFRFFATESKTVFWYTPTIEANEFNFGFIDEFEPIDTTWAQVTEDEQ